MKNRKVLGTKKVLGIRIETVTRTGTKTKRLLQTQPVFAMITNISGNTQYVKHNERICQAELFKDHLCVLEEIDEKPDRKTDRDGGFGSTGKK
jgi:dUTPase